MTFLSVSFLLTYHHPTFPPSHDGVETLKAGVDNSASCNTDLDLLRNLGSTLGSCQMVQEKSCFTQLVSAHHSAVMTTQASEQGQELRTVQIKHLEQESEQVQAHEQDQAQGKAEQPKDLSQGLDQTLSLLKVLNDTYRFVGLGLLKSILDNNVEFLKDPEVIRRCWAAIPTRFLDRLLRAPSHEDRDKKESLSMVQLAVAVLHTFIVRFSEDLRDDEKALGKIEGLLDILAWRYPQCEKIPRDL